MRKPKPGKKGILDRLVSAISKLLFNIVVCCVIIYFAYSFEFDLGASAKKKHYFQEKRIESFISKTVNLAKNFSSGAKIYKSIKGD